MQNCVRCILQIFYSKIWVSGTRNTIPAVILEKDGTPAPEGFDIDKYINTTFHMFNSEHEEVELICDNDVMDSIIDRFGEDVTTYANDMTSFRAVVILQ